MQPTVYTCADPTYQMHTDRKFTLSLLKKHKSHEHKKEQIEEDSKTRYAHCQ